MIERRIIISLCLLLPLLAILACTEKAPPREEIPFIKDLLGRFENAVRDRNAALIDSMIIAEAYQQGYNSTRILSDIYPDPDTSRFLKFNDWEFFYTEDIGKVSLFIQSDTVERGRPAEITLVKVGNQWLIKSFDLKDKVDNN
jgi:hypothetical protein